MKNRVLQHIGFWLAFTLIYALLNVGFAGSSDQKYDLATRFFRYLAIEWAELPPKLIATYGFLYYLLPTHFLQSKWIRGLTILIPSIFLLALLNRLINYYFIYPVWWNEYPPYALINWRRFLVAFTDILPAVATASTLKLVKGRIDNQKRLQLLQQEKLKAELHFLRAQMNPHFLFNTLNNIYSLARRNSDHTAEVVMKLSKILRYILHECKNEQTSIQKEVDLLQDYIELEQIRYGDRLNVNIETSIVNDIMIAPLLFLPLVENAFKHGVSETRFDAVVKITLSVTNDSVKFEVINTVDSEIGESGNGIGLKNVQRQLDLTYPNRHSFTTKTHNNMHTASIKIRLYDQ